MGKKTERKNQILQSAARLFSSRRFDEVLMDDIAQEAGVAKGTLYGYFPDKEELYFAVIFEGISDLNTRLRARVEKDTSPEEKLREMMHALVSFSRQNRFFFKLMSIEDSKSEKGRGENRRRWRDERGKQMHVIEQVLQSGVEKGVFCIRDLRLEAGILRDMVRSSITNSDGSASIEELVEVIMGIFLHGVKRKPA